MMPNKDEVNTSLVAVITGGTTGIGEATARVLAKHGYSLLLTALDDPNDVVGDLRSEGSKVEFVKVDLAAAEAAAQVIIKTAIDHFGRLDLLVNCAGVISHKEFTEVHDSDWDRIFAVNLKAPYFLIQQSFPHLKATGGSVINVSSTNAVHPARKNQLYDSLKAALNNLTQGFALEFRDSGVRVNAVMPGGVRTPLVEKWLREYLGREPIADDYDNPAIADPTQIAQVIAALSGREMSWINGAVIPVDGGFTIG